MPPGSRRDRFLWIAVVTVRKLREGPGPWCRAVKKGVYQLLPLSWQHRILRWTGGILAGLCIMLALMLRTPPGHRLIEWIAGKATNGEVIVEGLDGALPASGSFTLLRDVERLPARKLSGGTMMLICCAIR